MKLLLRRTLVQKEFYEQYYSLSVMLTKEASQELEYEIPHYVRNDKFRKTVE